MAKFIFSVGTRYVKSTVEEEIEVPDEELEGMTEAEIDEYVYKNYFQEWLWDNIYTGIRRAD